MLRHQVVWGTVVSLVFGILISVFLRAAEDKPAAKAAPKADGAKDVEPADNSYCYVCHANYDGEELTKAHQPVGVGCEKCHGESVGHSGDEDALTAPDKMYLKADVTPLCESCHEKAKMLDREEHQKFYKEQQAGKTCNECHGEKHRLNVRTRVWDKKTRKLVKDDGVRMMQKDSPTTGAKPTQAK
jgi:predicted CXXCH cytochrome family protein